MGYIEENLISGERLLYKAKLHWGAFVWPAINISLGFLIIILGFASDEALGLSCFGWIIMLSGLFLAARTGLSFISTEFGLTDRRIIAKTGIIRRDSLELMLSKVEGISVSQPIFGRLLGYGTIQVSGSGGTKQKFPNIAEPMELRRRVNDQLANIAG